MLRTKILAITTTLVAFSTFGAAYAESTAHSGHSVGDEVIAEQRALLAEATDGKG